MEKGPPARIADLGGLRLVESRACPTRRIPKAMVEMGAPLYSAGSVHTGAISRLGVSLVRLGALRKRARQNQSVAVWDLQKPLERDDSGRSGNWRIKTQPIAGWPPSVLGTLPSSHRCWYGCISPQAFRQRPPHRVRYGVITNSLGQSDGGLWGTLIFNKEETKSVLGRVLNDKGISPGLGLRVTAMNNQATQRRG